MATALHCYTVDKDGQIRTRHTFYGKNDADADALLEAHAGGDDALGPVLYDETIEIYEDVDELPDAAMLRELREPWPDEEGDDEEDDEDIEDEEEEEG